MKYLDLRQSCVPGKRHNIFSLHYLRQTIRKTELFLYAINFRRTLNLLRCALGFLFGKIKINSLPLFIKIELSAACNLACTVCLHSHTNDARQQDFHERMPIATYKKLVDEAQNRIFGLSLYYMGEAFLNRDIIEAIRYARQYRLSTHISSNFSFIMSDELMRDIVKSGLTHLTVCVDGLTNETYQRTRINGDVKLVIDNLRRIIIEKNKQRSRYPQIEVQFIEFAHNTHELNDAVRLLSELRVDRVAIIKGSLHNYADMHPDNYHVFAPLEKKRVPRCWWPWVSTTIKPDGEVLPCCYHRIADQFSARKNSRALGNINHESFAKIWNSDAYRSARALCRQPALFDSQPAHLSHFCYGCDKLFNTDKHKNEK